MSNIGKKPIQLKEGVTVEVANDIVQVSAATGSLSEIIPSGIAVIVKDGRVVIKKKTDARELEKFFGLTRALIANMVEGVSEGFEKKLELIGVGYRARVEGEEVVLNVGFANPVRIKAPSGIKLSVDENVITVSGIDKKLVGDVAAHIRSIRVPDPYKGKGIRYMGEHIRRKVGKAAKTVGAK